jgi:hypothetical protein
LNLQPLGLDINSTDKRNVDRYSMRNDYLNGYIHYK